MLKILNSDSEINNAKILYDKTFNDSKEFSDLFFSQYKKEFTIYGAYNNDKLIFITCLINKRIVINGEKEIAKFIVGVAVDESFRGKGIMKKYLKKIIEINSKFKIFIQAYNWDVYKSFNFKPCSWKFLYTLRKDQILINKKDELLEKIDFNLINKIRNDFIKINKIVNFSYRTEKENKRILKMHIAGGDKIIMTKKAYAIISNNEIIECFYYETIDLIKLISNLENQLNIWSTKKMDKRFFTEHNKEKIETKIFNNNIDILFSEYF